MFTRKYASLAIVLALAGGFFLVAPVFAETNGQSNSQKPAIVGTVSAISGNTITVTVKQEINDTTTTVVYTVNATGAIITKDGATITISNIALGDRIAVQGTVTGTNVTATTVRDSGFKGETESDEMRPDVVGKVSVISGNILTVVSNKKQNTTTATTYTVDVTNAKILRGETTITVADIAVGDNIVVQGTVTGTNVIATTVRDGKVGNGNKGDNNQALLQIQGNGQPVVAGKITVISGSTITIVTTSGSITYTVNASSAKIIQGKNTISLSDLKTGDLVIVQGAVNGTSITASTILDQASQSNKPGEGKPQRGFFGSIWQFFRGLFGF